MKPSLKQEIGGIQWLHKSIVDVLIDDIATINGCCDLLLLELKDHPHLTYIRKYVEMIAQAVEHDGAFLKGLNNLNESLALLAFRGEEYGGD